MLGSLCVIILVGLLNRIGKKKLEWIGNGKVDCFEEEFFVLEEL